MTWRESLKWVPQIFTMELRKYLSYRVEFVVNLLCSLFARAGLAYFLWREIYALRDAEVIAGYDFPTMMLYYVIAALMFELTGVELGFISTDIYEGNLTRFLVYPLPFMGYKYVALLARGAVHFVQIVLAFGVFYLIFGIPASVHITLGSLLLGLVAILLSSLLTFLIVSTLELVSFWVDKVWSLAVMFQMSTQFLGGGYLPLSAFPSEWQSVLSILPFQFLISFPVRVLFGEIDLIHALAGFGLCISWCAFFGLSAAFVWRRGIRQYSGVGI